jgi:PAS domain S-box-containing protein
VDRAARALRRQGLRAHLLALVLAVLVPAFGAGGLAAWHAVAGYRAAFHDRMAGTTRALALAVDAGIGGDLRALAILASLPSFGAAEAGDAAMQLHRAAMLLGGPLHAYDPAGRILADSTEFAEAAGRPSEGLPFEPAEDPTFRAVIASRQPRIGDLLPERGVPIAFQPVLRGERLVAVLALELPPERLRRILAGQNLPEDSFAALVDGQGRVVARSDEWHYRRLGQQMPAESRQRIGNRTEGSFAGDGLDGKARIFAFRRLTVAPGWTITVAEPEATYDAVWRPLEGLAIGAGGALLLATGLALALARRVLAPVRRLVRHAGAVAAGATTSASAIPPAPIAELEGLRQGFAKAEAALRRLAAEARAAHAAHAGNEAQQRELLATIDLVAVMTRDTDGTIRSWSAGCERLFGWTAAEAIGQSAPVLLRTIFPLPPAELAARLERDGAWSGELRHRHRDGTPLVVTANKALRRGAPGRPPQVVESIVDLTPLHRAEAALRVSEARWRAVVDSAADGILLATAEGRILSANAAALRMFGYPEEAALIGQDLGILMPMAEASQHGAQLATRRTGAPPRIIGMPGRQLLGVRAGGAEFPIELSVGSFESDGTVFVTGIIRDATERKAAEAALAQSEERLRLALEAGGMGAWDVDLAAGQATWDARAFALCGLPPPQAEGPAQIALAEFRALVLPADLPGLRAATDRAAETGEAFAHEFRIRRADTGRERWLASRGKLVPGNGAARLIGLSWDVTDRREADERHLLLMREVDHRAKNSLAVVQSVLALTRANDLSGFRTAVTGRIGAMARAHTLLARTRWDAVDLQALLQEELAVHLADGRVTLAGPAVGLAPGAAQPVAMVLHELATNAAKYGALSAPGGQVALHWQRLSGGGLCLRWRETGGPPVPAPPLHQGFGSLLVARTVERQLQGCITFAWEPNGLDCRVMLPPQAVRWPGEAQGLSGTG